MASEESVSNAGRVSEFTRASSSGKKAAGSSVDTDSLQTERIRACVYIHDKYTHKASSSKGTAFQDVRRLTRTGGDAATLPPKKATQAHFLKVEFLRALMSTDASEYE